MLLYKYRTNCDRTCQIITQKKVWFAKPNTLNDPLECWLPDTFSLKGQEVSSSIITSRGLSKSTPIDLQNIGIFSLTETCIQDVMWAHYAESGTGLVIGFDIPHNGGITEHSVCKKVSYTDTPIALPNQFFSDNILDNGILDAVAFNKGSAWRYECEWRAIEDSAGLKNLTAPISKIVFGIKCPEDVRRKYYSLVERFCKEPVEFYEIVIVNRALRERFCGVTKKTA